MISNTADSIIAQTDSDTKPVDSSADSGGCKIIQLFVTMIKGSDRLRNQLQYQKLLKLLWITSLKNSVCSGRLP